MEMSAELKVIMQRRRKRADSANTGADFNVNVDSSDERNAYSDVEGNSSPYSQTSAPPLTQPSRNNSTSPRRSSPTQKHKKQLQMMMKQQRARRTEINSDDLDRYQQQQQHQQKQQHHHYHYQQQQQQQHHPKQQQDPPIGTWKSISPQRKAPPLPPPPPPPTSSHSRVTEERVSRRNSSTGRANPRETSRVRGTSLPPSYVRKGMAPLPRSQATPTFYKQHVTQAEEWPEDDDDDDPYEDESYEDEPPYEDEPYEDENKYHFREEEAEEDNDINYDYHVGNANYHENDNINNEMENENDIQNDGVDNEEGSRSYSDGGDESSYDSNEGNDEVENMFDDESGRSKGIYRIEENGMNDNPNIKDEIDENGEGYYTGEVRNDFPQTHDNVSFKNKEEYKSYYGKNGEVGMELGNAPVSVMKISSIDSEASNEEVPMKVNPNSNVRLETENSTSIEKQNDDTVHGNDGLEEETDEIGSDVEEGDYKKQDFFPNDRHGPTGFVGVDEADKDEEDVDDNGTGNRESEIREAFNFSAFGSEDMLTSMPISLRSEEEIDPLRSPLAAHDRAVGSVQSPPKAPLSPRPPPTPPPPPQPVVTHRSSSCSFFNALPTLSPVLNPLSGNLILVRSDKRVEEISPENGETVQSAPVLGGEVKQKLYPNQVIGVSNVYALAAGINRQEGKCKIKVAAVVDVACVSSDQQQPVFSSKVVLIVWHWGYATSRPSAVQAVFNPPLSTLPTSLVKYDPTTLCVADGLVFLGGSVSTDHHHQKDVPCVYFTKPHVREVWSRFVLGEGTKVTSLAVTTHPHRHHKYVAVATNEGTVSVWSYERAASTNRLTSVVPDKDDARAPSLTHAVCYHQGSAALEVLSSPTMFVSMENEKQELPFRRFCTDLSWIPPSSSCSLLYLAATYHDGVVIYLLSLGHGGGEGDTSTTKKQPPSQLNPVAVGKASMFFSGDRRFLPIRSRVTWMTMGPHCPPCVAVIFVGARKENGVIEYKSRLFVGWIPLGERYDRDRIQSSIIRILESNLCASETSSVKRILGMRSSLLCQYTGDVNKLEYLYLQVAYPVSHPTPVPHHHQPKGQNCRDCHYPFLSTLRNGLSAGGLGVDSMGCVTTLQEDQDCVYHVHTQRIARGGTGGGAITQTHWLCRTTVGDRKSVEECEESVMSEDYTEETGGAQTSLVCELYLPNNSANAIPYRLVKQEKGHHFCVQFIVTDTHFVPQPVAFVMGSVHQSTVYPKVYRGRDVVFLPHDKLLVLSEDGSSLELYCRDDDNGDNDDLEWRVEDTVPMSLKLRTGGPTVWCRIFVVGDKLLFFGIQLNRSLSFVVSVRWNVTLPLPSALPTPKVNESPSFSLELGEEVISALCLSEGRMAVATTRRVLLLDDQLEVVRQTSATAGANVVLVPLGSRCVGFCAAGRLRYLSEVSEGDLATLPLVRHNTGPSTMLMVIRPDRFLYLTRHHSAMTSSDGGGNSSRVRVSIPTTRPLFLLEALVANCLSEFTMERSRSRHGHDDVHVHNHKDWNDNHALQKRLRLLMDKFGRKTSAFPYEVANKRFEGIGVKGVGITPNLFQLLKRYHCDDAADYLLSDQVLPPWLSPRLKAESGHDTFRVLLETTQTNEKSSSSSAQPHLPSPTSVTSRLSHEFAMRALGEGRTADAVRLLDLAGEPSSERTLLDLSLLLQLRENDPTVDVNVNVEAILQELAGRRRHQGQAQDIHHTQTTRRGGSVPAIARLALDLRQTYAKSKSKPNKKKTNHDHGPIPTSLVSLAPSFYESRPSLRVRCRNHLIDGNSFHTSQQYNKPKSKSSEGSSSSSSIWRDHRDLPTNSTISQHVYRSGPFNDREELLLLNKIGEWLGRSQPTILGKDGAELASEAGEKRLADILYEAHKNNDTTIDLPDENDNDNNNQQEGQGQGQGQGAHQQVSAPNKKPNKPKHWVEGVGEGRTDDENLSAYFRFSEGDDDDDKDDNNHWSSTGIVDLVVPTRKALVCGGEHVTLEATTSNVDEGKTGKVKLLYDLVFRDSSASNEATATTSCGLVLPAPRGSNLDVGMFHGRHPFRQNCTIEFWFYLPPSLNTTHPDDNDNDNDSEDKDVDVDSNEDQSSPNNRKYNNKSNEELVLMRRSVVTSDDVDTSKLCCATNKENYLWELVVLPSGELNFRTNTGTVMSSVAPPPTTPNPIGWPNQGQPPQQQQQTHNQSFFSDQDDVSDTSSVNSQPNPQRKGLVSRENENGWGGWNHVCLIFASSNEGPNTLGHFHVKLMMKGETVASAMSSVKVPTLVVDTHNDPSLPQSLKSQPPHNWKAIDDALEHTMLLFGLGPMAGFRMTELRVWSCERNEDDVKFMMHEYLPAAKTTKKLRVTIGSKKGRDSSSKGGRITSRHIPKLAQKPKPSKSLPLPLPLSSAGGAISNKHNHNLILPKLPGSPTHRRRRPSSQPNTTVATAHTNTGNSNDPSKESSPSEESMAAMFQATFDDFHTNNNNNNNKAVNNNNSNERDETNRHPTTPVRTRKESGSTTLVRYGETTPTTPRTPKSGNAFFDADFANVSEFKPSPSVHVVPAQSPLNKEKTAQGTMEEMEVFDANFDTFGDDKDRTGGDDNHNNNVHVNDTTEISSVVSLTFDCISKPLSDQVRSSAAAAIIRGPPATRHFGGNRGGLITGMRRWKVKHGKGPYHNGKSKKVGSIAICGTEKTVVYSYGDSPPGKTYSIGASGAITSDVVAQNEGRDYMCCFMAKEKRLFVFDLRTRAIIVELQMTTKLNFWRNLPPEVHGNKIVFLLITPVGGFHWIPLDESPRPVLMWKRGDNLQGKKIVCYEEGGCNGSISSNARSTMALLLASSSPSSTSHSSSSTVEAWCVSLLPRNGNVDQTKAFNVCPDVLGAAFCCPPKTISRDNLAFTPLVCLVKEEIDEFSFGVRTFNLHVIKLHVNPANGSLSMDTTLQNIPLHLTDDMPTSTPTSTSTPTPTSMHSIHKPKKLPEPTMATGSHPYVFVLCLENVIVTIFRRQGILLAFLYDGGSVRPLGRKTLDHFVVDACISRGDVKGEVKIILLMSLADKRDGFIAEILLSQMGVLC